MSDLEVNVLNSTDTVRAACPCCRDTLLRHIRKNQLYWFCSSCHLEIPIATEQKIKSDDLALPQPEIEVSTLKKAA
jgi:type III secretory pathway component EscR